MQLTNECQIFWATDEKFDSREVVRIQCVGGLGFRNRDQAAPPTGRQGFKNRIPENVRMVAVDAEVGAIFTQRLVKHGGGEFVKWVRAKIGVEGGCKRTLRIPKFRE